MMKRVLASVLTLAMLLSLAACSGDTAEKENVQANTEPAAETKPAAQAADTEDTPDYDYRNAAETGYWEMIRIDSENPDLAITEEELKDIKEQGIPMYLELLEDGTGIFCFEDITAVTWGGGFLTAVDDDTFTYQLEGNRLFLDMEELVCVYRKVDKPGSRISEIEQAGFTEFMEMWETYPYTTICTDNESKSTTGEATVIAYEIFESDEDHPAKEGYEWRVATIEVRFFDKNAQKYGAYPFMRHEDYYNVKLYDETVAEVDEGDAYFACTAKRIHLGKEAGTYTRIRESWSDWRKNSQGQLEVFYNLELSVQVPEGYDGAVLVLQDGNYQEPEGSYITDCDPEYFLMFRMD